MSTVTLMLTPWMAPHRVISWQRAVVLLYLGKVEVLEEYDHNIRSVTMIIKIPAVVRLLRKGSSVVALDRIGLPERGEAILRRRLAIMTGCVPPAVVFCLGRDCVLVEAAGESCDLGRIW